MSDEILLLFNKVSIGEKISLLKKHYPEVYYQIKLDIYSEMENSLQERLRLYLKDCPTDDEKNGFRKPV